MEALGIRTRRNGSSERLDWRPRQVTIGAIEHGAGGRSAFLAPPYDVVGPFSLDELETLGRIAFGACLVMSPERWREDQVELRREGQEKRRGFLFLAEFGGDDRESREILNLPADGALEPSTSTPPSGVWPRPRIRTPAAAANSTAASPKRATRCSNDSPDTVCA